MFGRRKQKIIPPKTPTPWWAYCGMMLRGRTPEETEQYRKDDQRYVLKTWRKFRREWRDYEWLCERFGVTPETYPEKAELEDLQSAGIIKNPLGRYC